MIRNLGGLLAYSGNESYPRELNDISLSALGGYGNDVDWKSILLLEKFIFTHFIRVCSIYYTLLLMQGAKKTNF